jgi:hypothetical protein
MATKSLDCGSLLRAGQAEVSSGFSPANAVGLAAGCIAQSGSRLPQSTGLRTCVCDGFNFSSSAYHFTQY